jgi:cytochrome b involved in lipid metabolism
MKNRLTSIIIGLVLVVGTGSLVYFTKKPIVVPPEVSNSTQNTPVNVTESDDDEGNITPAPVTTPSGITLTQIAQHSSRSNCWSAINGSVYDLTSWIPNHPGGEEKILSLCGIDGSSRYNSKHGGEAKPARMLAGFKLGILAQ